MATIKVKFRTSGSHGDSGLIYYLITHQRKQRWLKTEYRIYSNEWDDNYSAIKFVIEDARESVLREIRHKISVDAERLGIIVKTLEKRGLSYTVDDVISEFSGFSTRCSLIGFMKRVTAGLKNNGKVRTAETYHATLRSFMAFRAGEDIRLDFLTSRYMESYQSWLLSRGLSMNTVSFYARILRAVYNRAVEDGMIESCNPFKHVYTGVDKTIKCALTADVIKRINALDLSFNYRLDYARDMFILSFMLRGMSLIDMAYLKKTALSNGYLTYRRRKTGQLLMIKWTQQMQSIINKYPTTDSCYLLPIISSNSRNERCAYRNAGYNINRSLKKIAAMVQIQVPLTLYVARHSWASIARAKGVPLSVISEGMGHDSEQTTQIYLASLDTSAIDRANSMIIGSIAN
ncbi:MAG: site-specific integrase [Paramuribaculum sp.]|nr:site-specific integrase [Paramuribaculum sp.]